MTRRIAMFAYPGVQILDVVGPLEVFSRTTRWLREHTDARGDAYSVEIIGLSRGLVRTSSGLCLHAERQIPHVGRGIDTLFIAGGASSGAHVENPRILRWLRAQATRVRRLASVCTGAFFLTEAGLLAGRRATTHWASCDELARRYPDVRVEPDRLFVKEGSVYATAGVTAGIDLALALVEEDHGRDVALAVARARRLPQATRRTGPVQRPALRANRGARAAARAAGLRPRSPAGGPLRRGACPPRRDERPELRPCLHARSGEGKPWTASLEVEPPAPSRPEYRVKLGVARAD